jgi:hypothetical protein
MTGEICKQDGKSLHSKLFEPCVMDNEWIATNRGPGGQGRGKRPACSGVVVTFYSGSGDRDRHFIVTDQQKCDRNFVEHGKWVIAWREYNWIAECFNSSLDAM